jgi:YVTN family beta-propeller protein
MAIPTSASAMSAPAATTEAAGGLHVVTTVTFPAGSEVSHGITDPASGRIYVGNDMDNRVWSLDPSTFAKTLLHVGDCCGQGDLAFDPANHTLYTVGIDDGLYSLNVRTKTVGGFPLPSPQDFVLDARTQTLYVTDLYTNALYVVDARTHQVRATLTVGHLPVFLSIAVNPRTNTVYAINGHQLIALDGTTYAVRGIGYVGPNASDLQVDPVTDTVYLVDSVTPSSPLTRLVAIDGTTLQVVHRTSFAGLLPYWVDPANGTVYVVHDDGSVLPTSSTLTALDGRTGHVIGALKLSFLPSSVWSDASRGRVYLVDTDIHPRLLVLKS